MTASLLAFIAFVAVSGPAWSQEVLEEEEEEVSEEEAVEEEATEAEVTEAEVTEEGATEEGATEEADGDMEALVVTGSRIANSLGDIASQLIVIDAEAILAAGEVTLERLLRQLPQNQNPTTEQFGDRFNTGTNFTGASTVNLRGLGSESTLILIDGKRIGASGILGGVTDISAIPLHMVERIEIILDGASAIYGSDAVGGVVNVITKKDYEEVDVHINVDFPGDRAYNEFRGGIAGTTITGSTRISGSFNHSVSSGLDASDRDQAILKQSGFAGPQFDVFFCCGLPVFYRFNGQNITVPEFNALSPAERAQATPIDSAILPAGWTSSSSLDSINELDGPANWGAETQEGYSVLPEAARTSIAGSVETSLSDMLTGTIDLRRESRTTTFQRGYISIGGYSGNTISGLLVHFGNPFNPFDTRIFLRGQRRDIESRPYTETESSSLNWTAGIHGELTDNWGFEASFGQTTSELEAGRYGQLDLTPLREGLNSDGVTPITRFISGLTAEECAALGGRLSFGNCRVQVAPPDPVDPWGDWSKFISTTPLMSSSENGQTRLEGLVRGELMTLPGGPIRAIAGFNWTSVLLETITEFSVGIVESSPVSNIAEVNTHAERANTSFFFETAVPLIGANNASPGLEGLLLSLSARSDSYDKPDVTYTDPDGSTRDGEDIVEIGGKTTWGLGVVYTASDYLRVRLSSQSSFVAPQLNQVLLETSVGPNPPFRGLYLVQPNGDLRYVNAVITGGGNPELLPETADSLSSGIEIRIPSLPDFLAKVTYSQIDYQDRISLLSTYLFSPSALPSNTHYDAETDTWFQDRRWINVSSVERTGYDVELRFGMSTDAGRASFRLLRGTTLSYEFVLDPSTGSTINIVGSVTDEERDTALLSPVSETADSMQFTWQSSRLTASLDLNNRSETSRTFGATTSAFTYEYVPPTLMDLTVTYDLAGVGWLPMPERLEGSRLTMTINNLTNAFGESKIFDADGDEVEPTSPSGSPFYGRVIQLTFNASLGRR